METNKYRPIRPHNAVNARVGKHRRIRVLSALVVALATSCAVSSCAPDLGVPPLSGAIQVNEPDHSVWVQSLLRHDLDAVQVTLYARQQAWDSPDIIRPDDAEAVIAEIRTAKAVGLRVTLVLRVALEQGLEDNRHYWHGTIWPADDEVDAWFAQYRDFAVWGAEIAAAEDVDLLAVASELNSLTSTEPVTETPSLYAYFLDPVRTASVRETLVACADPIPDERLAPDLIFTDGGRYPTLDAYLRAQETADRGWAQRVTGATAPEAVDIDALNKRRARHDEQWRRIIADVRSVYGGPLSYAANFDQVDEVGFWDDLDAIGVNAYFPLSTWGLEGDRLDAALTSSWEAIAARLNELASRNGGPTKVLPVLMFELGWTGKSGSTVRPFSYRRVEVLETAPPEGSGAWPTLTCVHWATQPEDPFERVAALEALDRVVEQGAFPTLRGFTLWKLTTNPAHREIEPFAVVMPPEGVSGGGTASPVDNADIAFLEVATRLARRVRESARGGS